MELTVVCRVCKARFSARLPACPACGLERPAARSQREAEEFEPPEVKLELVGTRLAPKGSIVGIWLMAVGIVLFIGKRYERSLLLPSIGLFVVGVVALIYGLRRAHQRAQASPENEPSSQKGVPKA